jgi:hypothetical protein
MKALNGPGRLPGGAPAFIYLADLGKYAAVRQKFFSGKRQNKNYGYY